MVKSGSNRDEKTVNQKRSEATRARLQKAVATLTEQQDWPEGKHLDLIVCVG